LSQTGSYEYLDTDNIEAKNFFTSTDPMNANFDNDIDAAYWDKQNGKSGITYEYEELQLNGFVWIPGATVNKDSEPTETTATPTTTAPTTTAPTAAPSTPAPATPETTPTTVPAPAETTKPEPAETTAPEPAETTAPETIATIPGTTDKTELGDLMFMFQGKYEDLLKVYIDDTVLTADIVNNGKQWDLSGYGDYDGILGIAYEGSVVVVLKKEFLATLDSGIYTVKVEFKDGSLGELEFEVDNPDENGNPATGVAIALVPVGLFGAAIIVIARHKKR